MLEMLTALAYGASVATLTMTCLKFNDSSQFQAV